jgi:hypothetical protein
MRRMPVLAQSTTPCANSAGKGILIQIGFTNANSGPYAIPGANHTFLIAVDPTSGAAYATRGGPASGAGGTPGPGPIVASSGPYAQGFRDYGSATGIQTVGYVNAPFSQVSSYLSAYSAAVTAANLPYLGTAQNSNSYTGYVLAGLGFTLPTPALSAPGFGEDFKPIPNLVCGKP